MSTGGPDLFVVCKNCGSEVSPYITECPYCGKRLRKRAPKIDRHGRISERPSRRPQAPALPRLKRGEIPGIRPDAHPYATILLVVLGLLGCLLWRADLFSIGNLVVIGNVGKQWWRLLTAPFIYTNTGYAFAALSGVAIFGSLMEHRHGPIAVITLFLVGAVGGTALGSVSGEGLIMGASGGALCLLAAWSVPDLLRLRKKRDFDGDLLAAGVIAVVLVLMPWATLEASWIAGGAGILAGLLLGYLLYKIHPV